MLKHATFLSLGLVLAASSAAQAATRPSITVMDRASENYDIKVEFLRSARDRRPPEGACMQRATPQQAARCLDQQLEDMAEMRARIEARGSSGDRCEILVNKLHGNDMFEVVRTGSSCEIRLRR